MENTASKSEVLEALRAVLENWPGLELAILFDSRARGDARPDSDVDLVVQGTTLDPFEIAGVISLRLGVEADVVLVADATLPLLERILRDGIVVIECTRGATGSFYSRALSILETDRPAFQRMTTAYLRKLQAA